jgi:signal transduction histidine kinase/ActR/RegA family two-component response regulator
LAITLLSVLFVTWTGCDGKQKPHDDDVIYTSFRDVPGITDEEIKAVEELRKKYDSFSYGMLVSSETFFDEHSGIGGFTALFCEWLTELFDIPFIPQFHEWEDLFPTLKADFSGELTPTDERKTSLGYLFTAPIAERSAKYYRIAGSIPRSDILRSRPLRLAFLEGSTTAIAAIAKLKETSAPHETFYVSDYASVYRMLESGEVDAYVDEIVAETAFEERGNVVTEDFLPLIDDPVSLTTQNPELAPIISIVQKVLTNGGHRHLNDLYEQGAKDYLRHKLLIRLDERERAYLRTHKSVAYLAEYDNYPLSFYNHNEKQWQGIAFDILDEISALTGLTFEPVHKHGISFADLLKMLENGEGAMLSEVIRTPAREGRFLWPKNDTLRDNYVAISLDKMPNVNVHRVMKLRVGVQKATAYSDLFTAWFPDHPHLIDYPGTNEAFQALEDGEIDLLMYSMRNLLTATHYHERPGFKPNIVFDYTFGSAFGFHKDEEILCSIVDKAMDSFDHGMLADQWMRKTFDYRSKIVRSQRPWLIGTIGLFFVVIILTFTSYLRSRNAGRRLDMLVQQRTAELNLSRQELRIAFHDAETANRAKSAFLATMSHEIRTPMNAIIGIAQIELQRDDLPQRETEALDKIYNSGNNLLGIINDILDLSKIESGKLDLNPVVYDMPSLLHDTVQLNAVRIGAKQIKFFLDVNENLPSKFFGDDLRLKQILNNFLSNSIKYPESGHVKLSVNHLNNGKDTILQFVIEDTGQGMKPEDLKKLFSEFARFNTESNRATEGTGLGLMITKRLVEMMDGTIRVESEYGIGSKFTVEVRQKSVECEVIGADISEKLRNFTFINEKYRVKKQQLVHELMPYGKVLVVDDVPVNLYVAKGLMQTYKLNIETAGSGSQAIDMVKSGNVYDVIFMDHMMPLMDGIETTQKLRAMGYAGIIVALTANALVGNDEMFTKNGFDDYISKPIDVHKLNTLLDKYVRDKHPEEAKKHV